MTATIKWLAFFRKNFPPGCRVKLTDRKASSMLLKPGE